MDGDRELSNTWTGFTRFLSEKPQDGYTWSGRKETDENTHDLQTRQIMVRKVETYGAEDARTKKKKTGL